MKITATNKATGEIIELDANNPEEIVAAWRVAQEYDKAATALKNQLKQLVPSIVGAKGVSEPIGNYAFRISNIQRMSYDKSVMRKVLDADVFDVLTKPDNTAINKYLKENLELLGEASTKLRTTMLPDGRPYQVIRLEKLSKDGA